MGGFLPVPKSRVAFSLFGLDIMWYALMLTTGIVLGFLYVYRTAKLKGIDQEKVMDIALYAIPAGTIGARLYYVVFNLDYYLSNPSQILNFRAGGLAIHGALIFGIGTAALLLRRWKQKPIIWLDMIGPAFAIGQAVGRWGNYFNSEAHGGPTDLPWAIEVDGQMVHPTFLYESIWCLLIFIFLATLDRRNMKNGKGFPGQIFCLYVILYSVERYFVEGLRTDSLMIGPIRQAQLFSVLAVAIGLILYFVLKKRAASKALSGPQTDPQEAPAPEASELEKRDE